MNVIKCDIEVTKSRWRIKQKPVAQLLQESFIKELTINGDFGDEMKREWDNIEFEALKALISSKYIVGYTTTKNLRIFLFEKSYVGLKSKNSNSLEMIAFGDLNVVEVFRDSVKKIKKVLRPLKCNHIENSQLLIFPYNTQNNDIYSYELKVKADVSKNLPDKKSIARWVITGFVVIVALALYKDSNDQFLQKIYLALVGIGIVTLIDVLIHIFDFCRMHHIIEITNLSSVVEARDFPEIEKEEDLAIPKTQE